MRRYPLDQPLIFPNLPQLPTVHSAPVRKSSVLRAASALGIVSDRPQPIVYTPKRAWVSQATTVRSEALRVTVHIMSGCRRVCRAFTLYQTPHIGLAFTFLCVAVHTMSQAPQEFAWSFLDRVTPCVALHLGVHSVICYLLPNPFHFRLFYIPLLPVFVLLFIRLFLDLVLLWLFYGGDSCGFLVIAVVVVVASAVFVVVVRDVILSPFFPHRKIS